MATHLFEDRYDFRTIQELMGHRDVRTTMVYTHGLNRGGRTVNSPADSLRSRVPYIGPRFLRAETYDPILGSMARNNGIRLQHFRNSYSIHSQSNRR